MTTEERAKMDALLEVYHLAVSYLGGNLGEAEDDEWATWTAQLQTAVEAYEQGHGFLSETAKDRKEAALDTISAIEGAVNTARTTLTEALEALEESATELKQWGDELDNHYFV